MTKKPGPLKLTLGIACLLAFFANASQAAVMYNFTNFDGPGAGTMAGAGTNSNGISNNGVAVGFTISDAGIFNNFVRNVNGTFTPLNINGSTTAMAFGINNAGDVVGTDGNGNAFFLPPGGPVQILPVAPAAAAFGINDNGNIVGQFTTNDGLLPGFFISSNAGGNFVRIDSAFGPDTVNAQGINNNGLIIGFSVGDDGQVHGFRAQIQNAMNGQITGTPIPDPMIPPVMGEPGAFFVFSQILGINDSGLAVGYYGDSTTSQHGFLYDTTSGQYTFLDNPDAAFNADGVVVTQITGVTNSGELTGFYSDANGVFHGFVANPVATTVPEPASFALAAFGATAVWLLKRKRR
jgi:probable HAF family extracellular repeat protein